jgi:hypothetical protein
MKNSEDLMIGFSRNVVDRSSAEGRGLIEIAAELAPSFGIEEDEIAEYLTEDLKKLIKEEAIRLRLVKIKKTSEGLGAFVE